MGTRKKLLQFLRPDPAVAAARSPSPSESDDDEEESCSSSSAPPTSPSTAAASPYAMSPWTQLPGLVGADADADPLLHGSATGLLGSLVKEGGGHVYSLAAAGDLLYTGTDSRTVRVWRDRRELGGFRAGSGLVKAIVVAPPGPSDGRPVTIYTGHQDGKVRVWRRDEDVDRVRHRRVGSLPRARDAAVATSLSLLRRRSGRGPAQAGHADAVSCLSMDAAAGLLYSGSWDRTVRVWRLGDARCLETLLRAHDDAVNAVAAAGFDALLLTGAADGSVKVWRRETTYPDNKSKSKSSRSRTRHVLERVLRRPTEGGKGDGGGAVTAIAVAAEERVVYVGSSDGVVTHWRFPRPGCCRGEGGALRGSALRGHRMAVLCLAVSGRVVASGSADRTVSVWRREKAGGHARVAVLTGHTGPVKCLAVDAEAEQEEGRWVVYSGSLDGSVKVWRVSAAEGSPAGLMTPPPTHLWKGTMSPLPTPARAWTPTEPTKQRVAAPGVNREWQHDARARV